MTFLKPFVTFAALLFVAAYPIQSSAQDTYLGEKVFKKCKACHMVGADAKNRLGPQLNALDARVAGSLEDFKYSNAMTDAGKEGLVWDKDTLDKFLESPSKMIKKTRMSFPGLKKAEERTNVIAYLFSLAPPTENTVDAVAKTPTAAAPPEFTAEYMADPANIALGGKLWFGQCTHCHGFKAYPGKAPKLAPANYTADFVYRRVTDGFKKMPAWEDVFTQDERMAIVAYVKAKSFSP